MKTSYLVRISGNVVLDFDGPPFDENNKGGMYHYPHATTVKQAQIAHRLWKAMMAAHTATPYNAQDYEDAEAAYEVYLEILAEAA